MTDRDYRFDDHQGINPGESVPVVLDCFNLCATFWRANEQHSTGDFIRPNRANGFSLECTSPGTTGSREPLVWPTTIGATLTEGSVTWTCRAAGTNGISVIASPNAVSDPTGLTISDVAVSESAKILATYEGLTEGQEYDAVFTFTLNGMTRIARQRVPVKKR